MINHQQIVIIGAGNLATHLSKALYSAGHQIIQVYSRNIENAAQLSKNFGAKPISNLENLNRNADLFIIAVPDKAIDRLIRDIDFTGKNVVHTAGSVPLSIFSRIICNSGVFYPFQTFTKSRDVDFKNIPICIEANNEPFSQFLKKLANQLSNKVFDVESEKRKIIHLSGIFANNFVNHLYSIAEHLLQENDLPCEILHEIIKETSAKAIKIGASNARTGPASRNDIETENKHLDLLSSKPNFHQIYQLLSDDIRLKYK